MNYVGPHFDGSTYVPELDHIRLTGQLQRVYGVMSDGQWRTLSQLSNLAKAPESSVSARLRDLRKHKFGGYTVSRKRANHRNPKPVGLFYYRLETEPQQEMF